MHYKNMAIIFQNTNHYFPCHITRQYMHVLQYIQLDELDAQILIRILCNVCFSARVIFPRNIMLILQRI